MNGLSVLLGAGPQPAARDAFDRAAVAALREIGLERDPFAKDEPAHHPGDLLALFERHGIVRVESLDDALEWIDEMAIGGPNDLLNLLDLEAGNG